MSIAAQHYRLHLNGKRGGIIKGIWKKDEDGYDYCSDFFLVEVLDAFYFYFYLTTKEKKYTIINQLIYGVMNNLTQQC